MIFYAIHFHGRKKTSIGKPGIPFFLPADAYIGLHVIIPGGQILIADRPINACSILEVGLEIEVAVPVALSSPGERSAADLVTPHPGEGLFLQIGVFAVLDEEDIAACVAVSCSYGVLRSFFFGIIEPVFKIPGVEGSRGIILDMLDVAASFGDQGL